VITKRKKLIPAVGYLRKSTKGEEETKDGKRRQRQEKSIPQQKAEIEKLVAGRYEIVAWYDDPGISGWKRGAKRPGFARMMDNVERLGAQAIVCDNLDRFSRAEFGEVQADTDKLCQRGVRWIVTASHGTYDLGSKYDIGEILKFVVAAWSACEYSRQLSRRVSLAKRNMAEKGKRAGGRPPYGMRNDGNGGLLHGDPAEVKIVRWIFDQYANFQQSMNAIADALNKDKKVPSPRGSRWSTVTVRGVLMRECYRGDFSYNKRSGGGRFYQVDERGEVIANEESNGTKGKVYRRRKAYKPLVDPKLFDKAQRRLATMSKNRTRRKNQGYALAGVLVCNHCGRTLIGARRNGRTIYRCTTASKFGAGACKSYSIPEKAILPFVMRLLGQEITDLRELLSTPPDELREPNRERTERRDVLERERTELTKRIDQGMDAAFDFDKRNRKVLNRKIAEMQDRLEAIERELGDTEAGDEYSRDDLDALNAWHDAFMDKAVSVPMAGKGYEAYVDLGPMVSHLHQDPDTEEAAVLMHPLVVNALLHDLGTELRLRWQTETITRGGKPANRHILNGGRFRLGQSGGSLKRHL